MDYRDALNISRGRDRDDVPGLRRDRRDDVAGIRRSECPKKRGTLLRIFIPAGAEINLLDLIEISSPGGICIIIRLPFLERLCSKNDLLGIFDSIKQAGGRIEICDD